MIYETPIYQPAVAWDCDPEAVLEDLATPFDSEDSDEWIEHSMDRWGDRLTFRCTRGW